MTRCTCRICEEPIPEDEAAVWMSPARWAHIGCYIRKAARDYQHLDIATRLWGMKEELD